MRNVRLLLLATIIASSMPSVPVTAAPSLSEAQHERLANGDIVVLPVLPRGGESAVSQGGTAVARVRAPADTVWSVLVDYPGHRGVYPRVVNAEVLQADGHHTLVKYAIGVGPFSFRFYVDNFPDERRGRLDWRLAQGHANGLFRDTWGYWQIDPAPEGVTLTYAMAALTVLPAFMTRGAERDGLVETLRAVRARAETIAGVQP